MTTAEETKTRLIGWCPICERDIKLAAGNRLVHHGYRRPGDGSIHGDCYAVENLPYELSTDVCERWRSGQVQMRENLTAYLGRLERHEVTWFSEPHQNYRTGRVEYFYYVAGVTDLYMFERHLESYIQGVKYQITSCDREIARMDALIAGWALKPVRTVEELVEKERQAKAERKAERDAKKAAKDAKAAALKAKQAAREQERVDLMNRYREIFITLAEEGTPEAEAKAKAHWCDMHKAKNKKGYLHFYEDSLECGEAIVKLKLARYNPNYNRGIEYADAQGYVWHR